MLVVCTTDGQLRETAGIKVKVTLEEGSVLCSCHNWRSDQSKGIW